MTNRLQSAIILHVPFTTTLLVRMCWCGSMAEQLICNQQVDGSTPFTSSKYGGFPEWPKGADCKSVVTDFGGPNPPSPTNTKSLPQSGGLFVLVRDGGLRSPMQGSQSTKPISSAPHSTLDPSAARMWSRIHHPREERLLQSHQVFLLVRDGGRTAERKGRG